MCQVGSRRNLLYKELKTMLLNPLAWHGYFLTFVLLCLTPVTGLTNQFRQTYKTLIPKITAEEALLPALEK